MTIPRSTVVGGAPIHSARKPQATDKRAGFDIWAIPPGPILL